MRRAWMMAVVLLGSSLAAKAAVTAEDWGKTPAGEPVRLFTLSDGKVRVQVTEYGARIVSIEAPDRQGKTADIVLGYNNLAQYTANQAQYFGAVVGRYGNRIAAGTFSLGGEVFHVPLNRGRNALHGGPAGFSTRVWQGRIVGKDGVELTLISPDGDMGFPGTLTVHVRYTLRDRRLRIDYDASTTKTTVLNLTNHSFFNLAGEGNGDILKQEIQINADRITPVNDATIPTGSMERVEGTPFDFRHTTPIGARLNVADAQLKLGGGYDHNFVLNGEMGTLREAARAVDPVSGRTLTVLTTEPGLQFYSSNSLNGSVKGYSGKAYEKYGAFCVETQHFPDSPNHPKFPSTTLQPGRTMHSTTVFVFGTTNP